MLSSLSSTSCLCGLKCALLPIVEQKFELRGHFDWVNFVAISPDGTRIASGSKDTVIRLWKMVNNEATGKSSRLRGHTDEVYSVVFSPDGALLASGSEDLTVRLWNVSTREEIEKFEGHSDFVLSVAFSPTGQLIASGSSESEPQGMLSLTSLYDAVYVQ